MKKENVKQIIDAKKDNKARYALFRCVEEMYKDKPEGLYKYGYIEDLEKINAKNLYDYYNQLINTCKIDIFISGKLDGIEVEKLVQENENISKLQERSPLFIVNKPEQKNGVKEKNTVEEKTVESHDKYTGSGWKSQKYKSDFKNSNGKNVK